MLILQRLRSAVEARRVRLLALVGRAPAPVQRAVSPDPHHVDRRWAFDLDELRD